MLYSALQCSFYKNIAYQKSRYKGLRTCETLVNNYSCISGYTSLCFVLPTNALIRNETFDAVIIYYVVFDRKLQI